MISFLQIYNPRPAALSKIIYHFSGIHSSWLISAQIRALRAVGVKSGKSHKAGDLWLGKLPKTVNKAFADNQNKPLLEDARIVKRVSSN